MEHGSRLDAWIGVLLCILSALLVVGSILWAVGVDLRGLIESALTWGPWHRVILVLVLTLFLLPHLRTD